MPTSLRLLLGAFVHLSDALVLRCRPLLCACSVMCCLVGSLRLRSLDAGFRLPYNSSVSVTFCSFVTNNNRSTISMAQTSQRRAVVTPWSSSTTCYINYSHNSPTADTSTCLLRACSPVSPFFSSVADRHASGSVLHGSQAALMTATCLGTERSRPTR